MFRRQILISVMLVQLFALILSVAATAQPTDDIDWNRAQEIRRRVLNGEQVSPTDRAYFERAKHARQGRPNSTASVGQLPADVKPLSDMTAEDRYKGQDGGLYGDGKNDPPADHLRAALHEADQIRSLDAAGNPAENGQIALVSIGMSNTTQEFSSFQQLARTDPSKSPRIVLVDGAQGGMEAQAWAEIDRPWSALADRLRQAGISTQQVQVVWMKQARRSPATLGEFPNHTDEMIGHLVVILHKLKEQFPNLKIAYLSSRIYAGYARSHLNPEPYAYESAFAVRTLIQRQIKSDPALNFDPAQGKALAPLLLWGPYLWANGEKGRSLDDLVWKPEDFAPDGTHPSQSGRKKVAEQLLHFFHTDQTARRWYTGAQQ